MYFYYDFVLEVLGVPRQFDSVANKLYFILFFLIYSLATITTKMVNFCDGILSDLSLKYPYIQGTLLFNPLFKGDLGITSSVTSLKFP